MGTLSAVNLRIFIFGGNFLVFCSRFEVMLTILEIFKIQLILLIYSNEKKKREEGSIALL
jgi:hypothetical protein